MSTQVADLFVILDSVTDPFSKGMEKAAADAEADSGRMSKALKAVATVGVGLAVGVAAIGVKSIDMATQFQASMETLHTQAGVAQNQIAGLGNGVLSLAGQVGFDPNSLAQALFHIESSFQSTGITGATALNLLKISAEGAAVGHADLVDVTNALDAAIASGIPGVDNYSQAMGVLNSIVGSGDMTMQDLANSFSTGALANVKSYGASITDVGAALAVFGDNNIRGQNAATDLRMAMQALQVPAKSGADLLAQMGMNAHTLGDVMSKGGLLPALELLHQKMDSIGMTEQTQGAALTELFGKKAGAGIVVLYDQLTRLQSKYPDLNKGAANFADDWAAAKQTVSQQFADIRAGADALSVRLGMALLPEVSKIITEGQAALGQIESGFTGADLKVPKTDFHNAGLNQMATQLPLTAFQRFGQTVHTALGDLETFGQRLVPIGRNFETFGIDIFQAGEKIITAVTPTVELIGKGLFGALELAGKAAANILGPAIKDFADFLASHQGAIKVFSEVILGGLILKMTIIGTLNAAEGIVKLATAVVAFPLGQASEIGDAFTALKTAFTGKEAAEGEQAVQGLAGAFSKLKTAGSNILDKILPDSGKLAALSQMGTEVKGVETAATTGAEQLSLLDGNLQGIPWKMGYEQASLFDTELVNAGNDAETAAVGIDKAATSTGSLAGTLGKLGLVGGVIAGIALAAPELGKLAGVGDQTAISIDRLRTAFSLAASGSTQAQTQLAQGAAGLVNMSGVFGHSMQGLQQIDQSLAQMVSSGNGAAAKTQFDQIAKALQAQGLNATQAAEKFPQYEQAIKDAGNAAQTMDGQVQGMVGALQKQQAITQFNSDLVSLTQSIQTNGNALFGNSQQAVANQQAISGAMNDVVNFYQSQRNAGVGIGAATFQMDQQIQALEKTAINSGIAKGDVDKYIATLLNIPQSQVTTILANIKPAQFGLATLLNQINNSSGTVTVYQTTSGSVGSTQTKVQARASGGAVERNNTYWVGENGPELVTFGASGYVTPTNMLQPAALTGVRSGGGGSGAVVNNYFITNVAGSVLSEKRLVDLVRTGVLQYNSRNSSNGLSLP